MLKFFTRLEKTRNFILMLFAIILLASLVLFYKPSDVARGADLARSEDTAATVSGEYITVGDVYRQKESYSRGSQGAPSFPSKAVLGSLISMRIARVEAERLGLRASDAEVAAAIRKQFKGTETKPFDQKVYEQNVTEQSGSVAAFEETVRDDLSAGKLRAFLSSGVTVSDEEVLKDFQRKNAKFDLSYVAVNSTDLAQTITPSDQELRDYFEKNKQTYYINDPQKKIRYVFVNTVKIGEKLNIAGEDLRAEYDKLPDDKKIAGVLGQEIVLRVPKPEDDAMIFGKASTIHEKLTRSGQMVTETEFGDVAKGKSENPASAVNDGRLKGPVRENLNNPTDPYQRLITMKPGSVTEPISYQGRYFILRRGEDVPKSFEEAKKELEVSLRNRRAYGVAAELAQKVTDSLKQSKDPQKTAGEFAGEANMNVAEMVRETAYVKPGDDVPNIGTSPQFEEGIALLENQNDVGDKIPVQNGFAIPLLVEKKEPRDAEFDEVKTQITETVKIEKARAQVEEIAKQIAAGASSVAALAASAQGKNLKVLESKSFILGSPLGTGPSASTNEALEDAIFAMKEGEVTKTPISIGDSWFIVGVNKREEGNMNEFATERDSLMDTMLNRKRGEVFGDYLTATKQKMEAAGSIKIYEDALAKLDAPALPIGEPIE